MFLPSQLPKALKSPLNTAGMYSTEEEARRKRVAQFAAFASCVKTHQLKLYR